jgi:hypothetical protein
MLMVGYNWLRSTPKRSICRGASGRICLVSQCVADIAGINAVSQWESIADFTYLRVPSGRSGFAPGADAFSDRTHPSATRPRIVTDGMNHWLNSVLQFFICSVQLNFFKVDPFAAIPSFLAMTIDETCCDRRRLARRAARHVLSAALTHSGSFRCEGGRRGEGWLGGNGSLCTPR